MIIDFHTHCFPDKIASKAMEILRMRSGITKPFHDGSLSSLLELQKKDGVDYSVVLNIATNPKQQRNVNDLQFRSKGLRELFPSAVCIMKVPMRSTSLKDSAKTA